MRALTNRSNLPDYTGHRSRLKEKYSKCGIKGWLEYEVLEFALIFVIPRKDTKPIARELLSRFKTLNGVLNADIKELEEIKGVSAHTAMFICLLKDISVCSFEKNLYDKDLIASPEVACDYLKAALNGSCNEEVRALFLDSRNRLVALENIQEGTVNSSVIYPRKIVERALYNHAAGVIIAHNHPAGSLTPSAADIKSTKVIKDALKTVDIGLVDHIIVGGNGYFSFKENGV